MRAAPTPPGSTAITTTAAAQPDGRRQHVAERSRQSPRSGCKISPLRLTNFSLSGRDPHTGENLAVADLLFEADDTCVSKRRTSTDQRRGADNRGVDGGAFADHGVVEDYGVDDAGSRLDHDPVTEN